MRQAIILAAGKGSRLSKYTSNVPKALLPIKYGKTILERMLEQLIKNNIDNIIIVLGYQEANSNLYIKELSKTCNELNIITVNNLDYATTGTLKSLLIGLGEILKRDLSFQVVCQLEDFLVQFQKEMWPR